MHIDMEELFTISFANGSLAGTNVPCTGEHPVIVGRSRSCDVRVTEPDVSGHHLEFSVVDGRLSYRNLSSHGTVRNGEKVSDGAYHDLFNGDQFALGGIVRLTVSAAVKADPSAGSQDTVLPDAEEADSAKQETRELPPSESLKTVSMQTRAGSAEEVQMIRRMMSRRRKGRRVGVAILLAVFAIGLLAVWQVTKTRAEVDVMSDPVNPATKTSRMLYFTFRDEHGNGLVYTQYPELASTRKKELPGGVGIEVESRMGRDGDVPYFLRFERILDKAELTSSLQDSVWRHMDAKRGKASGLIYEAQSPHELKFGFFEDSWPNACQSLTAYGVRYASVEYQYARTNSETWRGVMICFRCGDAFFCLEREIPEKHWRRGADRLRRYCDLGVFTAFGEGYWESPGAEDLPLGWPLDRLGEEIAKALSAERAGLWRNVEKWIDAYLAKAWFNPAQREAGMSYLRRLREFRNSFYNGKLNAYLTARKNDAVKRQRKILQDCKAVFDNPSDRRYFMVNNSEVW